MTRFALVGHPVAHSLSPAIHAAAYRALGEEHEYELRDCPREGDVRQVLAELRAGELGGVNITLPHKRLALALADRGDELATAAGAANVWARAGSEVIAYNTDVTALVERFRDLAPRRAWVLGGGGAARAAVTALRAVGSESITLIARRPSDISGVDECAWDDAAARLSHEAATVDVIVQATSAGMAGKDPGQGVAALIPWGRLRATTLAYDVVYVPSETPFLRAAASAGVAREGGLGMLVGQAVRAVEIWLSRRPPEAPIREALALRLGGDA